MFDKDRLSKNVSVLLILSLEQDDFDIESTCNAFVAMQQRYLWTIKRYCSQYITAIMEKSKIANKLCMKNR